MRHATHFNKFDPDPAYDPRLDFNADGGISLADILKYVVIFNKTCIF